MNTRALLIKLSKLFPKKIAKKYHDYVGLMVGHLPTEVHKIVLCLDFDEEILEQVIMIKPDLIITHHPFFYGSKAKILKYNESKRLLYEALEKAHIPLISMHTNFDEGKGGMNDALAQALRLQDIYAPEIEPMMRIGYLETEMKVQEFVSYAVKYLEVDYGLLIQTGNKTIHKVGIIGGGGSKSYLTAYKEGVDIYISGDAPHHVRRDITNLGFNYLDVPHEVENIFMPTMKNLLLQFNPTLEVITIKHEKMPSIIKND